MRTIALFSLLLALGTTQAQPYVPGQTYFSAQGHIEYRCGDMPLLVAAPHGGYLMPPDMPDRTCNDAVWTTDANTLELALALDSALIELHGCRPHVVINHLHRRKFDANRNQADATCGDPQAVAAWNAFHDFLDAAREAVGAQYGKGFFVDLHGHGHSIQRLELGYLLYEDELAFSDAVLNTSQYINWSSLRNLATDNLQDIMHSELLQGAEALGTLLGGMGYPSVPSAQDPFPLAGQPYFSGGYNTVQHSSYLGGTVDGVQIECNMAGVRDTPQNRRRFADSLAVALEDFMNAHYFGGGALAQCLPTSVTEGDAGRSAASLFPSIAHEHLWLDLPEGPAVTHVVDALGRILDTRSYSSGQHRIDVMQLSSGTYALVVLHGSGRQSLRFIKE